MPSRQKLILPSVCTLTIPSEKYHKKFAIHFFVCFLIVRLKIENHIVKKVKGWKSVQFVGRESGEIKKSSLTQRGIRKVMLLLNSEYYFRFIYLVIPCSTCKDFVAY